MLLLAAATCHADTDPANVPAGIESWLKCFFWLVGGVTALVILWGKLFPKRNPPVEAEFVTKADLENFCQIRHSPLGAQLTRIESRLAESEAKREQADIRHEDRARLIHGRVNRLVPVVYTIAGKMNIHVPSDPEEG